MRYFRKALLFVLILLIPLFVAASVTVNVNGTNHTIPQTNERGWGANVTAWIQAISLNTLQPVGGNFTLTADVNWGATYGMKSVYYSTRTANPSTAGLFRMAKTDYLGWRNNANSANLLLAIDTSDNLTFNTIVVPTVNSAAFKDSGITVVDSSDSTKAIGFDAAGTTGTKTTITGSQTANRTLTLPDATDTVVGKATTDTLTNKTIDADGTGNSISNIENADIKAAAGIVYSKLSLANSIVSTDLTSNSVSSAKIIDGTVISADLSASAGIVSSQIEDGTLTSADLSTTGVSAGTYKGGVTVNTKGQVTAASASLDLTNGVTGTLPIANGGTNNGSLSVTGGTVYYGDGSKVVGLANGTVDQVLTSSGTTVAPVWATNKRIVQFAQSTYNGLLTGSTVLPVDDTVPQNTEGVEFMTAAITPTSATNILLIEASLNLAPDTACTVAMALFQDAVANALDVRAAYVETAQGHHSLFLQYRMIAGTTSSTTFKIRAGMSTAGTLSVNGAGGGRRFGGVLISRLLITEMLP